MEELLSLVDCRVRVLEHGLVCFLDAVEIEHSLVVARCDQPLQDLGLFLVWVWVLLDLD